MRGVTRGTSDRRITKPPTWKQLHCLTLLAFAVVPSPYVQGLDRILDFYGVIACLQAEGEEKEDGPGAISANIFKMQHWRAIARPCT